MNKQALKHFPSFEILHGSSENKILQLQCEPLHFVSYLFVEGERVFIYAQISWQP